MGGGLNGRGGAKCSGEQQDGQQREGVECTDLFSKTRKLVNAIFRIVFDLSSVALRTKDSEGSNEAAARHEPRTKAGRAVGTRVKAAAASWKPQ